MRRAPSVAGRGSLLAVLGVVCQEKLPRDNFWVILIDFWDC